VGIDARQQRRGWHELEAALASMRCGANDDMHAKGPRKYAPEQSIPTQADDRDQKRRVQIRTTILVCSMTALTAVNLAVAQRGFYIRVSLQRLHAA
jgi:hypothetical protein